MSCEHESVPMCLLAVDVEYEGRQIAVAHVPVFTCAGCGLVCTVTENGIEEYRSEAPQT